MFKLERCVGEARRDEAGRSVGALGYTSGGLWAIVPRAPSPKADGPAGGTLRALFLGKVPVSMNGSEIEGHPLRHQGEAVRQAVAWATVEPHLVAILREVIGRQRAVRRLPRVATSNIVTLEAPTSRLNSLTFSHPWHTADNGAV